MGSKRGARLEVVMIWSALQGNLERRAGNGYAATECDEIDKGFAGTADAQSGDSGTSKRVFGTIISWMQERKRPVFLVASANNVTSLPPELLRKGRFDELFAVDLPHAGEREEIVAIQLRRYKRNPADFDLASVANATNQFTGSELEAVVVDALITAFADGRRPVTTTDLVLSASRTVPLARTAPEAVDSIRAWAQSRARFASTKPDEATSAPMPTSGGTRKLTVR